MLSALNERAALLGVSLIGALWGVAIAAGGLASFYLCASLVACAAVLADFRIGVVLLIVLMPISGSSTMFPHEMFGIVGLNPLNLLLAGTVASCVLHALFSGRLGQLVPPALCWLYIVPILVAGALGSQHVGEISSVFYIGDQRLDFTDAAGYLRDMVLKPMLMVVFALLVGAAVARSARPERFLVPLTVSICVMAGGVLLYVAHSGVALSVLADPYSRQFLSALGMHANDLGHLYALAYALTLFSAAAAESRPARLALLGVAAVAAAALILTFSRGAFVAFAVVTLLYVIWRFSFKVMLVAALGLLVIPLFPAVYERAMKGQGAGLDEISSGRLQEIWLPLLPDVAQHPLLGTGIGSILWSQPMRRGPGVLIPIVTHPHSAFLQAVLDMGVVGLVLLCVYFVKVWRGFLRLAADRELVPVLRGFFEGAAAGLAGVLIADVTDSSLAPRPEQAYLWLAIGMMYGLYARVAATRPVPQPVLSESPA